MSRDDVGKATRIPASVLTALEDGQVGRLPDPVFVQNYIRAYATVIGVSADEVVLRYQELSPPPAMPVVDEAAVAQRRRALFRAAGVVLAVVALVWVFWILTGLQPAARSSH